MIELQTLSSPPRYLMAQGQTIIDPSNTARLASYIARNSQKVARPFRSLWSSMAEFLTPAEAKRAIRIGGMPPEWQKEFERAIREFVLEDVARIQTAIFSEVGKDVARRVNALPRKDFAFNATRQRVQQRIETHGAELVTRSVEAQILALRAALLEYVVTEAMTPFTLAKKLRLFIGLTERYSRAVLRLERDLVMEGLAPNMVASQVERYAAFLHKVRAENIARTELSFGYNFGQLEAINQASESGWLLGEVFKKWNTTGQSGRVCEDCEALDGEEVRQEEVFSAGVEAPPLHPQCGCGLSYETRR
jgi:hypothetical protein